eukprot:6532-Heterococcus_DN1.PRE.3
MKPAQGENKGSTLLVTTSSTGREPKCRSASNSANSLKSRGSAAQAALQGCAFVVEAMAAMTAEAQDTEQTLPLSRTKHKSTTQRSAQEKRASLECA